MRVLILLLSLTIVVAGCAANTEPPVDSVVSTPIADLQPVNADPEAIPTALPDEIVEVADAEYAVLTNVYRRSIPGIVNIEVAADRSANPYLEDISRGSGFMVDTNGHIVTNAHVVQDADSILVTFEDGAVAEAELTGIDTYSDLAVIKISAGLDRLKPLPITDSDDVEVGQRAIAIGNPFGLSGSMSVGIVSGIGRTLRSAEMIDANAIPGFQNPSIIQIDAPINPGNSGGPLLNSSGEVIGVTTAIRSEDGIFQGVGFAVPSNTLQRVLPELIDKGRVDYSWIGISVLPDDHGFGVAGLAEELNFPVENGVLIRGITVDSPADKAGLRGGTQYAEVRGETICIGGDIILAVNNMFVTSMDELVTYLVTHTAPGDTVDLLIVRNDETYEVPVTLEARPIMGNDQVRDCTAVQ